MKLGQHIHQLARHLFTGSHNVATGIHLIPPVGEGRFGRNIAVVAVGIGTHKGHGVGRVVFDISAKTVVHLIGRGGDGNIADGISTKADLLRFASHINHLLRIVLQFDLLGEGFDLGVFCGGQAGDGGNQNVADLLTVLFIIAVGFLALELSDLRYKIQAP